VAIGGHLILAVRLGDKAVEGGYDVGKLLGAVDLQVAASLVDLIFDGIVGDDDPLDICVLTEREVTHGNIIIQAIPIGGLRMIDNGEADDKIISVLSNDEVYSEWDDIDKLPNNLLNRLRHYFLTYKQLPGEASSCEITHVYGRAEAHEVIRASQADYDDKFGNLENALSLTLFEAFNLGKKQQDILKDL